MAWVVLGVSRLHHLLATGRLTSKDGAGRYAAAFGERWRPLAAEALAIRAPGEPSTLHAGEPDRLAQDVIEFTRMVVEAGLAIAV